jgi:hypothetical protein
MTTFVWTVNPMERNLSNNFVTVAHWQCVGTDGEFSDSVYSTASWTGEPATPYESLTQDVVLGWIWESVDKDATEAAVQAKIDAQKNPVTAQGVPW